VYRGVVEQRVISMLCVLCGGMSACYTYGACTVLWCGSVSYVWCVYCVVVWQRVMCMVPVMCGCVAACHRYGVCTVWWCGSVL